MTRGLEIESFEFLLVVRIAKSSPMGKHKIFGSTIHELEQDLVLERQVRSQGGLHLGNCNL